MRTSAFRAEGRFLASLRVLLDPADPTGLLVAVSGGCDSTALLVLATATASRHGRLIAAGHVHHGVRSDADREEARLRRFCDERSIPFRSHRLQLASTLGRLPSEAEMREARYRALLRLARVSGCGTVLLGHQRDDLAETFLINLGRGAGLRGLAGIAPRRGRFVRPLLDFSRAELAAYLDARGVPWVEDPTNLDMGKARNRVRRIVLPMLDRELRPGTARAVARGAEHLRRALDAVESEADRILASCSQPSTAGEIRLDADRLRSYHEGLAEIALQVAVGRVRGSTRDVPAPLWSDIVAAVRRRRPGTIPLPGGSWVEITPRAILVMPSSSRTMEATEIAIAWRSSGRWPAGGGFRATRLKCVGEARRMRLRDLCRTQVFDPGGIRKPVVLRTPRPGDRLMLAEEAGGRSLADLMSERGVPRADRLAQPVLADAEGPLWAPGIRRSHRAMVVPETSRLWVVRWFGPLPVDRAPRGGSSR